jgi:predicted ABC-type ATPase
MCAMELPTADATQRVHGDAALTHPPESLAQRERQRWVDRLAKMANPALKARMHRLEPGHPSSPWNSDGTPRPPIPRLSDVDHDSPGLTDGQYADRVRMARGKLEDARVAGLSTERQYAMGPDHQEWTVDRAKQHRAILDEVWSQAAEVPCERRAIMAGGLGGAGKTTVLGEHTMGDQAKYLTIDPDKFKEKLAQRGLVPEIPDLSPMEASSLAHEESSYLARQLALRATTAGKNIIWDITMSSSSSAGRRIDEMRGAGYNGIEGVFVDIPVETSVARTEARHRRGCDLYLAGQGLGGRIVPAEVIRAQRDSEFGSLNRRVFESLKDSFNKWTVYDNSADDRPAILIESGEGKGSRHPLD